MARVLRSLLPDTAAERRMKGLLGLKSSLRQWSTHNYPPTSSGKALKVDRRSLDHISSISSTVAPPLRPASSGPSPCGRATFALAHIVLQHRALFPTSLSARSRTLMAGSLRCLPTAVHRHSLPNYRSAASLLALHRMADQSG